MTENGESSRGLTNRQGHPVYDNQNQRTVGERGPATLENYQFLEKISHFDRERIPERVVHARGFLAHGFLEAYGTIGGEPASRYTRARLFQERGKRTPLVVRFSTVIGGRDSPETARDPRGFAVKVKTEDGNWDLVGNNLPVFFIRDAVKFPDVIHSLKPDPVTFRQDPNRIFDFMSMTPESMHMLTWLFSPRGIPQSYRHMDGFGVNTYKLVNREGEAVLVKYHWKTKQGIKSLTQEQASGIGCPECGHYKGALIKFRVVTDPAEQVRDEDQSCSTCGRERLKFTINLFADQQQMDRQVKRSLNKRTSDIAQRA